MSLVLKTAPTVAAITIEDLIDHLKLSDDEAVLMDTTLTRLIDEATAFVEDYTWRTLTTQTWTWYFDEWPDGRVIYVPRPPLQKVNSIKYLIDGEAVRTTFSSYTTDISKEPGEIHLLSNYSWPSETLSPSSGIAIEFDAGYGDDATDVPVRIRQAMLINCSMYYDGLNLTSTIDRLLAGYRMNRL